MSGLLCLAALLPSASVTPTAAGRALVPDTIMNFDSGSIELVSFPGEDIQPDLWLLDSTNTPDSSPFSLKLVGNTWKLAPIAPRPLDSSTVWQVSAFVGELGEIQGFGLADTAETLLYSFAGSEQVDPARWVTVYQGAFPLHTWNEYRLAVGEDWLARFGYLPAVNAIAFLNDHDTDPRAEVSFDLVLDVTRDLPASPQVEVWHSTLGNRQLPTGPRLVTVRFYSRVTDPDTPEHVYSWSFGDGGTSADSWPEHTYVVLDDHEYTVLLEVRDSTGRYGRASCRVAVDPGPSTFPVRLNFTGDVMLARRYDLPGGLIDTLGPEGVFAPTRPWLGDAADITVANLECPFTTSNDRHPTKPIVFKGRPSNVAGLAFAGIDVVSLANNHVIDYGLAGLNQTRHVLDSVGILHSGAGADLYEACLPVFRQQSGLNIAFLALSNRNGQYDNYQPYLDAGYNKPGFAYLDSFRVHRLLELVEPVADLRIVEMHSGIEYAPGPADEDDESYSRFLLAPTADEVRLRHLAIDAGADLVVCHHPHVLQGLEVYCGRIIAHSLGNFAFDQEYPETYPSAILGIEADSTGVSAGYAIPVYIDDYVPRRARGDLGCHILDYLARRSREFNTILVVDRESVAASIALDTTALVRTVVSHSAGSALTAADGYWTSAPLPLPRAGSVSRIVSVSPVQTWQFRLGRELVWFGNMEDEGATMWLLNQPDERYDTAAARGVRSLRQTRTAGADSIVTGFEERLPCYSDTAHYTLHARLRTRNSRDAGVNLRCFSDRTGSMPLSSLNLGTEVSGTTDWTFYHRPFQPPLHTAFFDALCKSEAPVAGTGDAWFDDVGIIEWNNWAALSGPASVVIPNDYYWLQVRTRDPADSALITFEETSFDRLVGIRAPAVIPNGRDGLLSVRATSSVSLAGATFRYHLPPATAASLKLYGADGREVRNLLPAGRRPSSAGSVVWDGRDNLGRPLSAGAYFCRLEADNVSCTARVIIVH